MLVASLKHFWQAFTREYAEARWLRMLVTSASAVSVLLTFVALFVNLRIPVRPSWLPWLLWIAVGLSLLLLLLLGFIANYRYHVRVVSELIGSHTTASDQWAAEKRTLTRQAEQNRREAVSERSQKEAVEQRATRAESDLYKLRDELEKSNLEHQIEKRGLQAHIGKLYRNYREKHLSQMKEISDLKGQVFEEKSKHAAPNVSGEIKEAYLKGRNNGLYITLRVLVSNSGAATTLRPFVLKFSYEGKEYIAQEEDDVTDFCLLTKVDKPWWPSLTKEESYTELTSLSDDNPNPLEQNRFREGWLRFRIPKLAGYMRGSGGEITLEVIDARGRVQPITLSKPWPQTGIIRFTKELEAEWDEAVERSRLREAEEAKRAEESAQNSDI